MTLSIVLLCGFHLQSCLESRRPSMDRQQCATCYKANDDTALLSTHVTLLKHGTYTIVNLRHKNSVLARNGSGSDLVSAADLVGQLPSENKKWRVEKFQNGNYTIKNAGDAAHPASCALRPKPLDPIVNGGVRGRSAQQWIIKDTRVSGHFLISPTDAKDLFWNMPSDELGTSITLGESSGDTGSHWLFISQPDDDVGVGDSETKRQPPAKPDSTRRQPDTPDSTSEPASNPECEPASEKAQLEAAPTSAPSSFVSTSATPAQEPVADSQQSSVAQPPPYSTTPAVSDQSQDQPMPQDAHLLFTLVPCYGKPPTSLNTGTYTISNVKYGKLVRLPSGDSECELVSGLSAADLSGSAPGDDEKWNFTRLTKNKFTIKNLHHGRSASCEQGPEADDNIVGGFPGRDDQEWFIRDTRVGNQFTISPTEAKGLFWNLPDDNVDTSITLQANRTDSASHWTFLSCAVDPESDPEPASDPPSVAPAFGHQSPNHVDNRPQSQPGGQWSTPVTSAKSTLSRWTSSESDSQEPPTLTAAPQSPQLGPFGKRRQQLQQCREREVQAPRGTLARLMGSLAVDNRPQSAPPGPQATWLQYSSDCLSSTDFLTGSAFSRSRAQQPGATSFDEDDDDSGANFMWSCNSCGVKIPDADPRVQCQVCSGRPTGTSYDLCAYCALGQQFSGGHALWHEIVIYSKSGSSVVSGALSRAAISYSPRSRSKLVSPPDSSWHCDSCGTMIRPRQPMVACGTCWAPNMCGICAACALDGGLPRGHDNNTHFTWFMLAFGGAGVQAIENGTRIYRNDQ
ncbi:hypothetical protein FB45DRAFT_945866 [Roridomyces roridus]|uniref:Ricin B lectin domain-containing protein n=1 Tax=Roridomyces roridus TaxID=1738132 RepID=A0AAD7FBC5_9AGAR|nr:hypothetical protein FB45DRAFT_945866 [Roridomyces roridus]